MNIGLHIKDTAVLAVAMVFYVLSQPGWCQEKTTEPEVTVTVARVEKTTLHTYVTAYGVIEAAPGWKGALPAGAKLASPIAGIVSQISCYEGLRVEKGELICTLDNRLAEADVEKALQLLALAEKTYRRQKELQASNATSEKNVQEAETQLAGARSDLAAARITLSLHRITAPVSGIVTRLNVRPGESVDAATEVAEIADFTRLAAALKVPAAEATVLKAGQTARIKTENDDMPVICTLTGISPRVDAASGSVTAYAALPVDTMLQPGRFVSARIASDEHRGCLAVPEASIVKDFETGWVIFLAKDGRAVRMPVKTGFRENGMVEVASDGLSEGMMVVKVGAYGLSDNLRIRIIKTAETEAVK